MAVINSRIILFIKQAVYLLFIGKLLLFFRPLYLDIPFSTSVPAESLKYVEAHKSCGLSLEQNNYEL